MEYPHETIKVPEKFLAWVYLHSENHIMQVDKHWHRSLELTYVLKGDWLFDVGGRRSVAKVGDLVLINGGEVHGCCMKGSSPAEAITIIFPVAFLKQIYPAYEDICFVLEQEKAGYTQLGRIFEGIYPVFKDRKTNPHYQLKLNSSFYEILYILLTEFRREKEVPTAIKTQKYMERCQNIIAYIDTHYREPISLDTLSRDYGISKEHLSRTFKECLGTTFKKYLTSIRMHHAYQDLTDSDFSILQIALDNGFSDSRSFTRAFRYFYGQPPQKYRKSLAGPSISHEKNPYLRTHGYL